MAAEQLQSSQLLWKTAAHNATKSYLEKQNSPREWVEMDQTNNVSTSESLELWSRKLSLQAADIHGIIGVVRQLQEGQDERQKHLIAQIQSDLLSLRGVIKGTTETQIQTHLGYLIQKTSTLEDTVIRFRNQNEHSCNEVNQILHSLAEKQDQQDRVLASMLHSVDNVVHEYRSMFQRIITMLQSNEAQKNKQLDELKVSKKENTFDQSNDEAHQSPFVGINRSSNSLHQYNIPSSSLPKGEDAGNIHIQSTWNHEIDTEARLNLTTSKNTRVSLVSQNPTSINREPLEGQLSRRSHRLKGIDIAQSRKLGNFTAYSQPSAVFNCTSRLTRLPSERNPNPMAEEGLTTVEWGRSECPVNQRLTDARKDDHQIGTGPEAGDLESNLVEARFKAQSLVGRRFLNNTQDENNDI
ncbi:hypothetical protein EDC01DRAFT_16357 [Geopyxis carbonaria]|nr:hypothetical protein EDC01DRAFT_16357 [Geopyxis carbonaria]